MSSLNIPFQSRDHVIADSGEVTSGIIFMNTILPRLPFLLFTILKILETNFSGNSVNLFFSEISVNHY